MATNVLTSTKAKRAGARDTVWTTLRIVTPGLLLAAGLDLIHLDAAAGIASAARATLALAGVTL